MLGGKTLGLYSSIVIVVNNITGPGMLVLPRVFQDAGWVIPTAVLVLICVTSALVATFLVDVMARIPGNSSCAPPLSSLFPLLWVHHLPRRKEGEVCCCRLRDGCIASQATRREGVAEERQSGSGRKGRSDGQQRRGPRHGGSQQARPEKDRQIQHSDSDTQFVRKTGAEAGVDTPAGERGEVRRKKPLVTSPVAPRARFQRRIEFVNVFDEYWGRKGMMIAQVAALPPRPLTLQS